MQDTGLRTAASADGTRIAYEAIGSGPPLIVVVGAFNDRHTGSALAAAMSDEFSVYIYDRRGRGDSGDTQPYDVDREVDDLRAVLLAAGGHAAVLGFSSGAALALNAAVALPIEKLIMFGPPIVTDGSRPQVPENLAARVKALVGQGQRGEAVELFQLEAIGMPPSVVEKMRHAPFRPGLEAMAHTLFYDLSVTAEASDIDRLLPLISMPTLVLAGADGPGWIRAAAAEIARRLPDGRHVSIEALGQDLDADRIAPLVSDFLINASGTS
ncbi:MAG: alpha/beta hydrolase [Mesorhizobium sp.]|uniref:alpha/beta fold hydrolase n=1 Tax=Mesorhizobium sp. TaxID=1871066 RepID=UPI000FEA9065|nr:alpha/beta hydrolase [Mesorhizobium sp.]RWI57035.1 MAG: alpha/beta hydrolase [Mesorhizobium sp.]